MAGRNLHGLSASKDSVARHGPMDNTRVGWSLIQWLVGKTMRIHQREWVSSEGSRWESKIHHLVLWGTSLNILFFIERIKIQICKQADGSIAQR